MPYKIDKDGVEVEVYTAEDVQAAATAAVTTKEAEFGKTKEQLEKERDEARTALSERTGEFKNFRKLNDEMVAKLGVAERTIYENQLHQKEIEDKRLADETTRHETAVDAAIRAKAGTDEKLVTKMKDMWKVIGIEANTQEEISKKVLTVLGAISTTEPDLMASVAGFSGGAFIPPGTDTAGGEKPFGETEKGKAGAAELGLVIEAPADKK